MNDVIALSKKAFTWSVVSMTILWSVGFAAFVPMIAHAAECPELEVGDLIKAQTGTAVYYIDADLETRYFPTGELYKTWVEDFSGVVTLSSECFAAYPQKAAPAAINYLPGSYLVTRVETPDVYAVLPGNMVSRIDSEEVAIALYGDNWGSFLRDVHTFHWASYTISSDELTEAVPHDGMLVTTEGSSDVYYVEDGMYHMVDGDLGPWNAFVHTVSQDVFDTLEMSGDTVTPAAIAEDPAQGATSGDSGDNGDDTPAPTGGDIEISLAASTPDTVTVPKGALAVPHTAFNVTAGDEDATLESITVHLGGIGSDNDFDKVYIYHNGARVDNGRTLNSDDEATFNLNLDIDAGDTETFWISGDISTTATAGDENYFEILDADAIDSTGDVDGDFPVRGNVMVIGSQSIGVATVTAQGSNQTADIGEDGVLVGQFQIAASSADDLWVAQLTLENKGTADTDALENIELLRGGTVVAEGEVDGDYITFEFDDLFEIEASDDETFKIYSDIGIAEDTQTFQFVLDETSDFVIYSEDYDDFQAGITNSSLNSSNALTVTLSAGEINVDWTGSNEDVRVDQNNVVFGVFEITATAEDVDVDQLEYTLTKAAAGDKCLEDLRLRDANGRGAYQLDAIVACTTSQTTSTYKVQDITLSQGVTYEFELVGDIASDADTSDAYTWSWDGDSVDAGEIEGVESDNQITGDDFSSGSLSGPTMTVAESSLTVRSKALTDDTVVNGTDNVLMFRGTLQAGDVSDIEVTSMTVQDQNGTAWDNLISDLRLFIGNDINVETDSPVATDTSVDSEEAVFNGFSYDVEAGSSNKVTFEIWANIEDSSTTGTIDVQVTDLDATDEDDETVNAVDSSAATVTSGNPVTTDRDITVSGTGSLTVVIDNDFTGLKNASWVLGGETRYLVGMLELQATNEDVRIEDLGLHVSSTASSADITASFDQLTIHTSSDLSDDNEIGSVEVADGDVTLTDLNFVVPDGETTYLWIGLDTYGIGTNGTAIPSTTIEIRGDDANTTAEGVSSNSDLAASAVTVTETTFTKETTLAGVTLTASADQADGTMGGSSRVVATFNLKANANNNRDITNGSVLSAHLLSLNIELFTDVGTASSENVSNIQLCRVDTSNCITLGTVGTLSDTTTTVALETDNDGYVDITNFTDGSDQYIDNNETVSFELKATFANVGDNDTAEGRIADVNNGGITWAYDRDDDGTDDYTHTDLRAVSRPSGYPDIVGGSLL